MDIAVYSTFGTLTLAAASLQLWATRTQTLTISANNPQFKSFQLSFFVVYFMALFADWLQGPYVYKLYAYYGFTPAQIAILYVVGFASSGIFGTVTGSITDKFGRKNMSIIFCVLYSICCLTKLSPNFVWLMIGRIMGGIATSLLFSSFESWYLYEHTQTHDFPTEWISATFSKSTFWNGLLAINAGIVANVFAETLNFGPISPFMIAIPFLGVACLLIVFTWKENFGNRKLDVRKNCTEGLRTILFKESILYLGIVQSLFEAYMYIFVFQWTPVLESKNPPLGMVFASFMVCIMIGSSLYSILLSRKYTSETLLFFAVTMAILSAALCCFSTSRDGDFVMVSFLSFLIFEVGVGMYFPAVGFLRSQVIPEDQRAGIMNWFRLPTNFLTCCGLLLLHHKTVISSTPAMFAICFFFLILALIFSSKFIKSYREPSNAEQLIQI